jgi:hypothetical protein
MCTALSQDDDIYNQRLHFVEIYPAKYPLLFLRNADGGWVTEVVA